MNSITIFLITAVGLIGIGLGSAIGPLVGGPVVIGAVFIGLSLKMANAWEKFVILRAGKLHGVKGAGLFLMAGFEETSVGLEFERARHDAGGISKHAILRNDGATFDTPRPGHRSVVLFHIMTASKVGRSCHPGKMGSE